MAKQAKQFFYSIINFIICAAGIGYIAYVLSWVWINIVYKPAHNKYCIVLYLTGAIASFTASVFANDQNDRLKNSAYGGIVTTGISAVMALIQKEQTSTDLILFSVFGSAVGALLGWMLYAVIAMKAFEYYGTPLPLIELITNGLNGIRRQIISKENGKTLDQLNAWWDEAAKDLKIRADLITADTNPGNRDRNIEYAIEYFLSSLCAIHNILYRTNQMRASLILFNVDKKDGIHWISAKNHYKPFDLRIFDNSSKAHKLLNDLGASPYMFVDTTKDKDLQDRSSERRYKYFSLFKIDERNVLTLDWPDDMVTENIELIRGNIQDSVKETIAILIKAHTKNKKE